MTTKIKSVTSFKKALSVGQRVYITSPYDGASRETKILVKQTKAIATASIRYPGEEVWLPLPKASEVIKMTKDSVFWEYEHSPGYTFGITVL